MGSAEKPEKGGVVVEKTSPNEPTTGQLLEAWRAAERATAAAERVAAAAERAASAAERAAAAAEQTAAAAVLLLEVARQTGETATASAGEARVAARLARNESSGQTEQVGDARGDQDDARLAYQDRVGRVAEGPPG